MKEKILNLFNITLQKRPYNDIYVVKGKINGVQIFSVLAQMKKENHLIGYELVLNSTFNHFIGILTLEDLENKVESALTNLGYNYKIATVFKIYNE